MAFRRAAILAAGGFDPGFRFYLDETDLDLRLAATGVRAALVPLAQVHHAFAESARRRADRVPVSLHEVGASLALFLRRHADEADRVRLKEEAAERRAGLQGHLRAGRIGTDEMVRLIATLHEGWEDGCVRPLAAPAPIPDAPPPFLRWERRAGRHHVLSGRSGARLRLLREGAALAREGDIVSLYLLSPTARRHRIAFLPEGVWLQEGGLFGASLRSDPVFRPWRHRARVAREVRLVASLRQPDAAESEQPQQSP